MALNINTKNLLQQFQKDFEIGNSVENTPIERPVDALDISDPKQAEDRLLGIIGKFSPVATTQKFEDYSRYIKGAIDPIYGDIDEERAQAQSNFAKAATVLPRIGTKVVSEVAKIPGEIYGLADWGVSGFKLEDFEEKVNNVWVKSIEEAHRATNDAILPVYTRRVVEEGGLLRQIVSPEFWANEGADGVGFLVSMMGPGLLTRAAGVGAGVGKLAKATKLAKAETAAKTASNIKAISGWTDDIVAGGINTIVESTAEGIEASNATRQALQQNKFQELINSGLSEDIASQMTEEYMNSTEAKRKIGAAGANTVKANLGILLAPNIIDQKWLFSGLTKGAVASDLVESKLGKVVAGLGKEASEKVGRATTKEIRNEFLKKFGIGVAKEGFFEEGMQFASAKYFEDKAILGEDPNFLESIGGTLETYIESLSDVDMQKSIFLGSLLGGVMGGVGAARNVRLEDKVLFGDKKKGTTGLANLLEQNFINRFQSLNDITEKDAEGNPLREADGISPKVDPVAYKAWMSDILKDEKNKKLLEAYNEAGLTEDFEFAKMVHDFNYMLPFIQQEGGMELLQMHLDQLSGKQAEYLQSLGVDNRTVDNVKKELQDKANIFSEVYYGTMENYKPFNVPVDEKHLNVKKQLDNEMLDTKVSNQLIQYTLRDRVANVKKESAAIQSEISKLEAQPVLTNTEEVKLKELTKQKEALDKKAEDVLKEIELYKESFKQLDDKKAYQEELNLRIREQEELKKDAAKDIADNVQTKKEAEEVKTSVEQTDLDNKTKQEVKDKADTAANNKEAEEEILRAADEKTLRAIAAKVFKNFQAKKQVDPLTPEEETLITSNPENALKLDEYFKELQNAERAAQQTKVNQQKLDKYVEYTANWEQQSLDNINEETLSTEVTYYNTETDSIEKAMLEADSIEQLYEKINNFYSEGITAYSSYIGLRPPAYTSKALEQLNKTRTVTSEITPIPEIDLKNEEKENAIANRSSDILTEALVATVPAVAYRSKQGQDTGVGVKDTYNSEGKIQLEEGINEDILYGDKYDAGTELFAEIDTESAYYEANKDNIESIPIKLTDGDGKFVGYIHDVNWYDNKVNLDPAIAEELKRQTRVMRNNFLVDGKIQNRRLKTKINRKYPGWLNRTEKIDGKRKQLTVEQAFGKDPNVKIGVLNTTGPTGILAELNWAKDKDGNYLNQLLNKATGSGIVIAAVPAANGSYLLTRMNQSTLSSLDSNKETKPIADKIVKNVVGILINAVKDKTINKNDLFTQLKPYLYAHMGLSSKEKQTYMHSNPGVLFGVDLFDSGTERNVVVDLDFGTNASSALSGYVPFKITEKDGKVTIARGRYTRDATGKTTFKTEQVISPEVFGEYIKSQTKNKYVNYDQSLMNEWHKGKKVKIIEADNNYNVKEREVDYRDFISENRVLTTAVHGVKTKDGRTTYVTQPTLELDWNNFKEDVVVIVQETTTTPQEPIIPSTELPRTNSLTDENLDFDGFEGFEETTTDFLKISVDIDYNNANIASFSNLSNLIRENELVNSLTASAIFLNKTVNIDFDSNPNALLDKVKSALEENRTNFEIFSTKVPTAEEAATYKVAMNPKINAAIANNLKQVLDNFEEVRDEQGKIKFIGYRTKINMELNKLKFTPEEMEMLESMPENSIEELHLDNKTFRTDPEKSMSSRVKRELYSLPVKEKGKAKVSMIGLPLVRDYSTTFNSLMEALSNEDINEMINELRELANSSEITDELYKQTLELIEKHSNDNSTFVNEFLSVFKKQKANFKIAIIESQTIEETVNGEKVTKPDNPKITIIDANKSGASNLLMEKWKPAHEQALVEMGMLKIDNINDNYTINQKIAGELATGFISVSNKVTEHIRRSIETNKVVTSEAFKELSDYFNKVGLSISPQGLFKLYKDYLRGKSKKLAGLTLPSERSNDNFPLFLKTNFGYIFSKYMDEGGENKVSESGLDLTAFKTQRQYINVLAKYESIVNPSVITNSHRNGNGDIIYGYVNPSHLSNTIDNLKKDTSIEADVFSRHSTWKFKTDESGELSINEQALKDLDLHYFDSTKNRFSKKDAVSFEEMNPLEKEQTKLSMYHNNTSRLGLFLTVSPSDKTTFSLIQAAKQNVAKSDLTQDGLLKNGTQLVDSLFDLFVVSEIDRINETLNKFKRYKKGELTLNQLTNEVDYIKLSDGTIVPGAGSYFFMIPQFNDYYAKEIELAHKEVKEGNEGLIKTHIVPDRVVESKGEMVRLINRMIELKKDHWDSLDMYNRINKESFINLTNKYKGFNVNTAIAVDYVVNTMISYANQFMLITGDPATFAKVPKGFDGKISSWRNLVDTSTANLFKRAAKDIAPGYEGRFEPSEQKYRNVFINEPVVVTKNAYKDYEGVLKDVLTVDSSTIKLADAQIWSSLPEHLKVLNAIGRINKATKDALIAKYNNYMKHRFEPDNKFKFTDAELGVILQPIKPVEVGFINDSNSNKKLPIYIKSSKFPLIPQLTEGLEIDKMLTFMYENNIDNIVPHTAIKTGFSNAIDLFDDERIVLPETIEQDRIHVLDRSILRIQQDVPYDPNKTKILEGSQLKKLKYSDLELDWNFELNDTQFKGHELKDIDDRIHTELYRRAYNDFLKSIKAEETAEGTITLEDFSEISKAIIEEAQERGFDINDVMLLSTFLSSSGRTVSSIPLFLHPAMPKIEPLLNSLIKNKILVTKFPGKSYVQGSSLGFQFAQVGDEATIEKVVKKQGIVLTSKFTGKLSYASEKKGDKEVLVADVFVPWYFKEKLTNFLNEDGTLNEDKIDPEMFNLIGYRIPTQGHSSMIKLRVVGFLPESSGDLIIIPPDLVKQMGSDFDVDKLYVHRYNYKTDEGGNINKVTIDNYDNLEDLSTEQLQNLSLEITHSILENENVIKRTVTPLDNNKVRDAISEMNQLKKQSNAVDLSKASHTSLLYDDLHSQFVDINAAGKFGIGVSSIASTGHVLGQYAGFYIKTIRRKEAPPIRMAVRFTDVAGNPEFNEVEGSKNGVKQTSVKQQEYDDNVGFGLWRLDRIYNIAGETISSVIQNIQTESVDNANNQNLYGMALNKHTFDVGLFLAKAGLTEEYIIRYLNQPIIKEYIRRVNAISDIGSTEYTFGKEEEIAKEMGYKPEIDEVYVLPFKSHPTKGGDSLSNAIREEGREFNNFDRQVLHNFMKYKEIANKLSGVLRAINVDTRYLGKNLDSNISKQKEFETNIVNQKQFGNLHNLQDTLQDSAFKFGVDAAVNIFDNLVPYNTPIIRYLREKQEIISGRERLSEDVLNEMNRSIRTSLWIESLKRSTNISDIESYRKNLLFNSDPDKKNALAFKVAKERLTNNNTFLKFLELNLQSGIKNPSTIEFPAGGNVETDISLKMQQSFLDLYNNPETKQLARDLMVYALTNGAERNARDFARFIPIDMLISEGIVDNLKSVYGESFSSTELNENLKSVFLKQFYQHNPFRAFPASTRDLLKRHKIDGKGNATTYLNNTHRIKMKTSELDGKSITNTPEFIYFYDNGKNFLFNLVELTEENVVYERVPLLGNKTSMLTEYNLTTPNKESIFSDNNIAGLVPYQRTTNIQIAPKPTESFTGVNIASKFGFIHQGTNFNQVLNNITQSDQISNGLKALANILATQQFNVTMEVGDNNTVAGKETLKGKFGAFIPSNKGDKIVVNLDSLVPNFGLNADNAFALGILHEAIHALTSSKIENRKNLSTEEQQIIDNIEKQWKKAKDVIDNNDGLKEFRYYTSSLKEFAAGLSDPRFQRVLNDIKSEGSQSILDKIIDLITEMINIVAEGIDINSDSVLAQTLQDVLKLTGGLRTDIQQPTTEQTTTNYPNMPEFNKLPVKSQTPTMTYAGIGSRQTPVEIQTQMTELAKELESRGYTLRSGHAQGADMAFEKGVNNKKEIFLSKDATNLTRTIAKEIHPNPKALGTGVGLDLMARNTNQIFGQNLDTPVDFVIAWTQDGLTDYRNRSIKSGGTGQAIDMASRKGIPVINMANPNWREQLDLLLSQESTEVVSEPILDENISLPGTQGSWVPTDESPIYKELSGGNLYKFELTGGIVSKGYYAQGNSLDWKEMNPKNASKKYNEIERDGMEQTGKFVEYDSEIKEFKEQPIANIFKFADGIEINTGNIKLNQQQTEALQHLSDFYNNKTKTFALKGYAGTGKTTILNFFKEYVAEKNRQLMLQGNFKDRRYIQFTTPTHRANAIIRLNTKSLVNTLHSLFGLSPVLDLEEFSARDAKFAQQNQKKISAGDLLIIDESSMINDALYDFITKEADKSDVKVIFVGDPKQLKPIKQDKLSKAFSQVDGTYELTQVMRTGDTPLLSEVTSIRTDNNFSYQTSLTNNQGIVYTNNRRSFADLASEIFISQQFRENPSVVRILSGTNDGVREMNELVRKALWGEAITNQYNVGELLIGFDNYNIQYGSPTIMNSVDYFVRDVSGETDIELSGVKAKVITILVEDMFDLDNPNRFKKVTMLSKNNPSHVFEELGATFEMLRLRAISESNKGNKSYWKQFYAFKDSFATPVDISFKGDVKIKKTLDYGYAMTIHKSQGGTYGQIYLDADSINKFPDNEVQQQLKYVGLSRASDVAVVLSNKTNKDGTTELTKETKEDFLKLDTSEKRATFALSKSYQDLIDSYELIKDDLASIGITDVNMIRNMTPQQVGEMLRKYCK